MQRVPSMHSQCNIFTNCCVLCLFFKYLWWNAPIEFGDDFSYGLGCSSRGGYDVLESPSTISPVLSWWTIHSFLGGSNSMDCGHQTLNDSKLVIDDLSQRSQTISGAGSIWNYGFILRIASFVNPNDKHRGVSRRGRDYNLLCSSIEMSLAKS